MAQYKLTEVSRLGENDPKYGQRYWGRALESQVPISFNSTSDHTFMAGDIITFEEMSPKKSNKGTDYMQLKKVKLLGSEAPRETQKVVQVKNNNDDSINRAVALKGAVAIHGEIAKINNDGTVNEHDVLRTADLFLNWLKNEHGDQLTDDGLLDVTDPREENTPTGEVVLDDIDTEPVDLSAIPF